MDTTLILISEYMVNFTPSLTFNSAPSPAVKTEYIEREKRTHQSAKKTEMNTHLPQFNSNKLTICLCTRWPG